MPVWFKVVVYLPLHSTCHMTDTEKHLLSENSRHCCKPLHVSAVKRTTKCVWVIVYVLCSSQSPWLYLGTLNRYSGLLISHRRMSVPASASPVSTAPGQGRQERLPELSAEFFAQKALMAARLLIIAFVIFLPYVCYSSASLSLSVSVKINNTLFLLMHLQLS